MKKNSNVWVGIVVIIVLFISGTIFFINTNKQNTLEPNEIVTTEPNLTEEVGGDAEVATTPISYASALVAYKDRRIQLDTNCQAHPNNVTYKDNTGIMIDNRSPEERTVKAGITFTIKPWGFKIIVLPNVYLSNKTILVDCDQSQNVATILIQE
jgi:flagellar basal body-associated protein FliL